MTPQTLTWVRNNIIFALNCGGKPQRGQLAAFEGFAGANTKRYGRHRARNLKVDGRWYCRDTEPVYAPASRAGKRSSELISPEEYSTSRWRRAIYSLDDYEKAWILYSYGGKMTYMNHMLVCEYIWLQMMDRLKGRRVTDGMTDNLIRLAGIMAWNAAQIAGGRERVFASTYAAQEIGVSDKAWWKSYKKHWEFMCDKCAELDHAALENMGKRIKKNGL
ncbi:hypothetical protein MLA66_003176 [Salmonella enterica]|nr:hypothetical protein [Salmonella enterica]EHZ8201596.1 hypothetical protein [Salmonella enterica]EIX8145609.1 hypothetical protein [Salmonella enterica]HBI5523291.1 hypothetical protein [Salmonella enterica subsp. enterica serovar Welikade]